MLALQGNISGPGLADWLNVAQGIEWRLLSELSKIEKKTGSRAEYARPCHETEFPRRMAFPIPQIGNEACNVAQGIEWRSLSELSKIEKKLEAERNMPALLRNGVSPKNGIPNPSDWERGVQ